jgi:hypothetical protein
MSERKLFAHELEARLDELLLLSLRQRSAKAPAAQLEALPRELQERVLHWAGVAAQTSDDLGWLIASLAAAQAADLGDEFDDWVRAGLDAYDRSGLAATRKALNDYAEACRSRAQHSAHGIAFAAIEGRLSHFLHALDGRPLKLATGPQAWTDSETLWLPERLDAMPDAAGNRGLYKAMAALLWAQTRFGSFNVDPEPELDLWPDREAALRWFAALRGDAPRSPPGRGTARARPRHRRSARPLAGGPCRRCRETGAAGGDRGRQPCRWLAELSEKSALARRRFSRTSAPSIRRRAPRARRPHRPRHGGGAPCAQCHAATA